MSAIDIVLARLKAEEGEKLFAYDDATGARVRAPQGKLSWGRGFNLDACGSSGLFDVMERYLIEEIDHQLKPYSWYGKGGDVRTSVFLDIGYNAGVSGLLHFPSMLAAADREDWASASSECDVSRTNPSLDKSRYAPLRQLLLIGGVQ